MLFHITATHSEDNCPGYNMEIIPDVLKGLERREEIAREQNVKIIGMWSAAPEHVFYMVVEANSVHDIDQFVTQSAPFKQDYRVSPVLTADELAALGREMMAQANS
jgi:Domain of unknown function (DUF3303)